MGVKGVELEEGDVVVGLGATGEGRDRVLAVCERGYGKQTPIDEFRLQSRGGKGVILIDASERNGPVVGVALVAPPEMIVTDRGQTLRNEAEPTATAAQGVRLMDVEEGDYRRDQTFAILRHDDGPNGTSVVGRRSADELTGPLARADIAPVPTDVEPACTRCRRGRTAASSARSTRRKATAFIGRPLAEERDLLVELSMKTGLAAHAMSPTSVPGCGLVERLADGSADARHRGLFPPDRPSASGASSGRQLAPECRRGPAVELDVAMAISSMSGDASTRPTAAQTASRRRFTRSVPLRIWKPWAKMSWLGLSSRT
jgi:hypothetical protein